jgi:hypothetical protein
MGLEIIADWISITGHYLLLAGTVALGVQFLTALRFAGSPQISGLGLEPARMFRALPVVGFMFSISPAAAARNRPAVPPTRSFLAPAPPWSRLGGFPPPLPLSRAQGPLSEDRGTATVDKSKPGDSGSSVASQAKRDALESVWTGVPRPGHWVLRGALPSNPLFPREGALLADGRSPRSRSNPPGSAREGLFPPPGMPTVSGEGSAPLLPLGGHNTSWGRHRKVLPPWERSANVSHGPLFPRAGRPATPTPGDDARSRETAGDHGSSPLSAGSGSSRQSRCGCYVVVPGDNLWKIASRTLETLDKERIADYWVRIYRHNRDLIGPDPNLVRPGQVLDLPEV